MITVKPAVTDEELADTRLIRHSVFVVEQGVPSEREVDEHEDVSLHFILYADEKPAGTGRLRPVSEGAKVERVCVLRHLRGSGHGAAIMKEMEKAAIEKNFQKLLLHSQTHAQDFYKNLGYKIVSEEPFMDAGILHVKMEKTLTE
ncbi:GNAT family N-acetyltransferase [Alkalicoccus luteus]|uniref:GNAT family N-acetyltransferase n=1 Tax=Alkalicoccus luteus TaxID=1237094 RepID=A0A969TUY1_9BACI|nr:GNAT family N-acetyltransferase [Alkalicoccus luteus]NJP39173.1 GNAT family N-acetyltransferase [Alkalicoccus luteus]